MVGHFDFNFVVAAIVGVVGRIVGDGVLIAKFLTNVLEGLIQIIDMIGIEGAATGFLGEGLENLVAIREMVFAIAGLFLAGVVEGNPLRAGANGVDNHTGALGHFDGFGARVR